ncbi:MAG: TonB-dependent receptor [Gammaproteobacteria bacterium]|nr:TonB-dependent receptor [Gammaproteobacteria bacterium]
MKLKIFAVSAVFATATTFATETNMDSTDESSESPKKKSQENVVVVKSEWREKSLLKTPASIAILTNEKIAERNAFHVDQMLNAIANLNFNTGANRGRFIQIRGIGERSQFSDPINPSVGFYIDGTDLSGTLGAATLFDVAQLEVLRGPQSTRFGASALAGAVYLSTEPADSETSRVTLTAAEANTFAAGVASSTKLNQDHAIRLSLHQLTSDGFITNQFLNRDDTNNRDELTTRFKYQGELSENFVVQFNWHHIDADNGYDAFSLDNNRLTRSDQPGFDKQKTDAVSVIGEYTGFGNVDLGFNFGTARSDLDYGYDEDWTFVGFHPDEYSSFDRYIRDRETVNADITLNSHTSAAMLGGKTDWTIGLYVEEESETLVREYTYLANDFTYDYETSTVALYGELQTEYSAKWSSTIGLRFENRPTDYLDSLVGFLSTDDNMVSGRIALDYQFDRDTMYYGLIARGFKAGGVNPTSELPLEFRTFDNEQVWNYEIGLKKIFEQGNYRLAAFYMERDNQQVNQYTTIVRGDGTTQFIPYINNADNGRNLGLEFELTWFPTDKLAMDLAIGYLETEIDSIFLDDGSIIKDREAAQAPTFNYHLAVNYSFTNQLSGVITFEGKDDYFFSESHQERSKPVDLIHWKFAYDVNNWNVSIWMKNALDKTYFTRGFGGFGNDPRDGYTAKPYYQLADPKQVGVTFNYNY